ncbi:MAG: hypothetical protein IH940_12685, partial [Acidobacteria bacterium]|nr:hypothetical protein [Acidobacteriota bacterium]
MVAHHISPCRVEQRLGRHRPGCAKCCDDAESVIEESYSAALEGAPEGVAPERFGVIFGSGIGGISTMEAQHDQLKDRGPGRVSPFFIPMFIPDIAAGLISIRFGAKGPNYATVSACASGAHAIGDAFRFIQRG